MNIQTRHYLTQREWLALSPTERAGVPFGVRALPGIPAADGKRSTPLELSAEERARLFDQLDSTERVRAMCFSSDRPDRYQSVIAQEGRDDSEYHGQWLWGHDYGACSAPGLPIGREVGEPILVKRDGLTFSVAAVEFAGIEDHHALAESLFRLIGKGMSPDCSIGFLSLENEKLFPDDDDCTQRLRHLKWKRIEVSCVPIGANTDAQAVRSLAKREGIDLKPIIAWAVEALDNLEGRSRVWVPRQRLERFLAAAGETRGLRLFDLASGDFDRVTLDLSAGSREDEKPEGGPAEPAATEPEESPSDGERERLCASCGAENPASNKYCGECGALMPLPEAEIDPEDERSLSAAVRDMAAEITSLRAMLTRFAATAASPVTTPPPVVATTPDIDLLARQRIAAGVDRALNRFRGRVT